MIKDIDFLRAEIAGNLEYYKDTQFPDDNFSEIIRSAISLGLDPDEIGITILATKKTVQDWSLGKNLPDEVNKRAVIRSILP